MRRRPADPNELRESLAQSRAGCLQRRPHRQIRQQVALCELTAEGLLASRTGPWPEETCVFLFTGAGGSELKSAVGDREALQWVRAPCQPARRNGTVGNFTSERVQHVLLRLGSLCRQRASLGVTRRQNLLAANNRGEELRKQSANLLSVWTAPTPDILPVGVAHFVDQPGGPAGSPATRTERVGIRSPNLGDATTRRCPSRSAL